MDFYMVVKAILSRLLFFGHGIACVYLYAKDASSLFYWFLVTPLVFLLVESCVTCVVRSGKEYKYVWPSGFFYITCIIPIIWLTELDLYDMQEQNVKSQRASVDSGLLSEKDLAKKNREIILMALDSAHEESSQLLKKICELGLMICIVIARWLMPRGSLTKDQLSALLLVYVGNSADILELFDTFEEPSLVGEQKVLIAVMCVFTWSIYQFTLVTTATQVQEKDTNPQTPDAPVQTDPYGRKVSVGSGLHPASRQERRISVASGINSGYSSDESAVGGRYSGRKVSSISEDPFRRTRKISNSSHTDNYGRKISIEGNLPKSRKVSMAPSLTRADFKNNTGLQNDYVEDIRARTRKISVQQGQEKRGRGRKSAQTLPEVPESGAINEDAGDNTEQEITRRKLHGELYQILVTLLMQDGPFLVLRLYLIIQLKVTSEMHIFFTCKNAIVSLLLIYRLLILSCHGSDEEEDFGREEAATKLHNIQMAMHMDDLGPLSKIAVK